LHNKLFAVNAHDNTVKVSSIILFKNIIPNIILQAKRKDCTDLRKGEAGALNAKVRDKYKAFCITLLHVMKSIGCY
jgi:hypothetical protein